jgi:hypothetical protein|tara:strand:+ start:59 stop:634 length:576 start_codon:yes stop_codon:yes gene_type:complete
MANFFTEVKEGEPLTIVAGDFLQWKRSDLVDDYPTASYTVNYIARIANGANEINITASGQSDHYLFQAASSATASYTAGDYHWQVEIVRNSDSERHIITRGHVTVLPDLDVNNSDPRSHAEIMLGKIESLLSGKADSDVSNYAIQGRSLTKMSLAELIDAREMYLGLVNAEKAKLNAQYHRKTNSSILVRF